MAEISLNIAFFLVSASKATSRPLDRYLVGTRRFGRADQDLLNESSVLAILGYLSVSVKI